MIGSGLSYLSQINQYLHNASMYKGVKPLVNQFIPFDNALANVIGINRTLIFGTMSYLQQYPKDYGLLVQRIDSVQLSPNSRPLMGYLWFRCQYKIIHKILPNIGYRTLFRHLKWLSNHKLIFIAKVTHSQDSTRWYAINQLRYRECHLQGVYKMKGLTVNDKA